MSQEKGNSLIRLLENYIEIWKQFSRYLGLARTRSFTPEDESEFLETKCLLAQELEMLLDRLHCEFPGRKDIHDLIARAPSLAALSEARDDALRVAEAQWHKIYIGWQAILGQLKSQERSGHPSRLKSWFGGR